MMFRMRSVSKGRDGSISVMIDPCMKTHFLTYWQEQYWLIVVCVTIGGAIGGLLYWTAGYIAVPKTGATADGKPMAEALSAGFRSGWRFAAANVFTGTGGAWAVVLAMLWAKRAPVDAVLTDRLELLATSMIAGYAGNRVLPAVAERLTKDLLNKAIKKTTEAAESAKDSQAKAKQSQNEAKHSLDDAKKAGKIAEINAYIARDDKHTLKASLGYIETVASMLHEDPTYRPAAFALASLQWDLQGADAAVKVLNEFIEAKHKAGSGSDKDVADAYWNIAWYYWDAYNAIPDGEEKNETQKNESVKAMLQSLKLKPEYKQALNDDEGFTELREDTSIKAALAT
jgi:hypothetical protein